MHGKAEQEEPEHGPLISLDALHPTTQGGLRLPFKKEQRKTSERCSLARKGRNFAFINKLVTEIGHTSKRKAGRGAEGGG